MVSAESCVETEYNMTDIYFTSAVASSNSKRPTPVRVCRSSQPKNFTQTPLKIKGHFMWTYE